MVGGGGGGGLLDFRVTPNLFRIGLRFGRSLTTDTYLFDRINFPLSDKKNKRKSCPVLPCTLTGTFSEPNWV